MELPPTMPVVLLFPGQGAQHPGMGVGLYHSHSPFREAIDEVFALWGDEGAAIRADWLDMTSAIDATRRSQPLLFALDYALGTVVLGWGIAPRALLGHSVGEVVAAVFAGVLTLPAATALVADRVRHIEDAPAGGMLVVAGSPDEITPHLLSHVHIGAVNAARQVMVAGPDDQLRQTGNRLREAGMTIRGVGARSPFHSPLLAEAAKRGITGLSTVAFGTPRIPLYSGYTGGVLGADHATDPSFWSEQPARPVYFADALAEVSKLGDTAFVESGPGQSLTSLAARKNAGTASTALPTLPRGPRTPDEELRHLHRTRDRLHALGAVPTGGNAAVS